MPIISPLNAHRLPDKMSHSLVQRHLGEDFEGKSEQKKSKIRIKRSLAWSHFRSHRIDELFHGRLPGFNRDLVNRPRRKMLPKGFPERFPRGQPCRMSHEMTDLNLGTRI